MEQQHSSSSSKKVANAKNAFKLKQASSAIAGTADGLKRQLAKLDAGVRVCTAAPINLQRARQSCWQPVLNPCLHTHTCTCTHKHRAKGGPEGPQGVSVLCHQAADTARRPAGQDQQEQGLDCECTTCQLNSQTDGPPAAWLSCCATLCWCSCGHLEQQQQHQQHCHFRLAPAHQHALPRACALIMSAGEL